MKVTAFKNGCSKPNTTHILKQFDRVAPPRMLEFGLVVDIIWIQSLINSYGKY